MTEHWRYVDCISDLHLHSGDARTFAAFRHYLETTPADALFILGDWFEVWVGDDVLESGDAFITECVAAIRQAAQRIPIFALHGNRDFLLGQQFAQASHTTLLPDPYVLEFANQRWVLTHGDAWCVDDTAYMQFRQQVRSPQWQTAFLQRPLPERIALARHMREHSAAQHQKQHQNPSAEYADVDSTIAIAALRQAHATTLIHGHTHRPALHVLGDHFSRWVLSDWDMNANPPRADVLRIGRTDGVQRIPCVESVQGVEVVDLPRL